MFALLSSTSSRTLALVSAAYTCLLLNRSIYLVKHALRPLCGDRIIVRRRPKTLRIGRGEGVTEIGLKKNR